MGNKVVLHELRLKEKMILLGMVFMILIHGMVDGKLVQRKKLSEIDKKLKQINRPAVKSIQSEDGDIIDCVDIYKQPALDHPAMKNHTIEKRPFYYPAPEKTEKKPELHKAEEASQLWLRSGSCPEGTIPIRRIRKQDLLRAISLEEFGRKKPSFSSIYGDINQTGGVNYSINSYNKQDNISVGMLLTQGSAYVAAQGDINVWNPSVASDNDYSGAYIALKSGPYYNFESVESGWVVNPSIYGDRRTRLFSYWTADASKKTGCFDLLCSGFVQTSSRNVLGGVVEPVSVSNGGQYKLSIYITLNPVTGNWWLQVGDNPVGYWPKRLFGGLSHMASSAEWGGEVRSSHVGLTRPHTATDMGSGRFPGIGYGFDCFIRNIRIVDNSRSLKFPTYTYPYADEYSCYDIYYKKEYVADPEFYFGGPGYDELRCP